MNTPKIESCGLKCFHFYIFGQFDSIFLQDLKLSINALENKTSIKSRNSSPGFYSRESLPKPAWNQNRTKTSTFCPQ